MFIWTAWALLRNSRFGCSGEQNRDSETNGARGTGDQAGGGVAWTLKQSLISFFFLMREHILSVTKSLKEDPAEKPK